LRRLSDSANLNRAEAMSWWTPAKQVTNKRGRLLAPQSVVFEEC
jgi:hypothetical protein